uniref:Uncharacterized protein n=1 Tax=Glossina brevipalpis TaxID=37001 RepID=A0A1A9WQ35_9MUSC
MYGISHVHTYTLLCKTYSEHFVSNYFLKQQSVIRIPISLCGFQKGKTLRKKGILKNEGICFCLVGDLLCVRTNTTPKLEKRNVKQRNVANTDKDATQMIQNFKLKYFTALSTFGIVSVHLNYTFNFLLEEKYFSSLASNMHIIGGGGDCGFPAVKAGFIFILARICDKFDGIEILLEVAEVVAKVYRYRNLANCLLIEIRDEKRKCNLSLARHVFVKRKRCMKYFSVPHYCCAGCASNSQIEIMQTFEEQE